MVGVPRHPKVETKMFAVPNAASVFAKRQTFTHDKRDADRMCFRQYATEEDSETMGVIIDRIFACAAWHEVDVLVLPPIGCGAHGCNHPALEVADHLHKAALKYGNQIANVVLASDHPSHFEGELWEHLSRAFQNGRPPVKAQDYVPLDSYLPYIRHPKDEDQLA